MTRKLPTLTGAEVVRVLERAGWSVAGRRGSQIIPVKDGLIASLSVPDHDPVAKGTLRALLRAAGLSVDEFEAMRD